MRAITTEPPLEWRHATTTTTTTTTTTDVKI